MSTTRLAPQERRRLIVEAASRVVARRGPQGFSVGDVAEEAGVTRGLVHHYVGGREALALAVAESLVDQAPALVRTGLDLPVHEMVARNVDAWLDHWEAHRDGLDALLHDDASGGVLSAAFDRAREAIIDRVLLNHLGTTEAPPAVRLVLRGYTALSLAACAEWLRHGRAGRDEVHALLTHGLLALLRDVTPEVVAAGRAAPGG